ncbi:aminotransferase class V-fold PLP-dependent enzyme [Novosphingobium sp. SG720]|uniref:aminotransferase class V-fold PLP-dependent enzyme n=1 Tax=Novosphingobium sp. SG720 TaxID=2586998 RepID=UPI0014487944|nr:aminotransferase class V-fold PLP-dependent enzyme [Novosphingobium sp. SG720]NKJ42432.1 selenocysteine lyase/cysteine desulfurase [Novosphingobium sp. SG720]
MRTPAIFVAPARPSREVYFANAAHGLPSAPVLQALQDYLVEEAEWGAAQAAQRHETQLAEAYAAAARLIGADVDEVAFLESGNRALQALILSLRLEPGDHVLVDRSCWGGTLGMLADLPGVVVDVMPADANGRVDVSATAAMVHPATRCILLTWCPATSGIVNPAQAVGALARNIGVPFLIDACQMLGQRPVDVRALGCHGLAASGRKWLRGPRGTALLYVERDFLTAHPAFMADQIGRPRSDARMHEPGEANQAGRMALGVAIQAALTVGLEAIAERLAALSGHLRAGLSALPGVTMMESGEDLSAIVAFRIAGIPDAQVMADLARRGIRIGVLEKAHAPIDMAARELDTVLRAAPQVYTSEHDVDALVQAVADLAVMA